MKTVYSEVCELSKETGTLCLEGDVASVFPVLSEPKLKFHPTLLEWQKSQRQISETHIYHNYLHGWIPTEICFVFCSLVELTL